MSMDGYDPEPDDKPSHKEYCDDDECPCQSEANDTE